MPHGDGLMSPETGQRSSFRSSTTFVIICISVAVFTGTLSDPSRTIANTRLIRYLDSFLYGFVVPLLPYLLEVRNGVAPAELQRYTYLVLTLYGGVACASAISIGHLGDSFRSRKTPLLVSLLLALLGTLILAAATECQ